MEGDFNRKDMDITRKHLKLYYLQKFGLLRDAEIYFSGDTEYPPEDQAYVEKMKMMTDEFVETIKNHPHPEEIIIVPEFPLHLFDLL